MKQDLPCWLKTNLPAIPASHLQQLFQRRCKDLQGLRWISGPTLPLMAAEADQEQNISSRTAAPSKSLLRPTLIKSYFFLQSHEHFSLLSHFMNALNLTQITTTGKLRAMSLTPWIRFFLPAKLVGAATQTTSTADPLADNRVPLPFSYPMI